MCPTHIRQGAGGQEEEEAEEEEEEEYQQALPIRLTR
ncbi:hypothetical protein J2T61_001550 [Methanocalculus sp. AMF5]|nr:hypothetical protein [Methanocalculus sp. AMF5]